ncbi:MAG TPA: SPOR domain-containing protein [Povalibacter sp.]|uniref:SPOR domain-containing protein n=1 Tax=Povalibacter sp. TaxID=1962978 RepID=UPI002C83C7D4|nr:SPOR domain-containing protein [Povalibacter sp.]HMN43602.1 SPOR domain-containing protein [Povalibacter sp.]
MRTFCLVMILANALFLSWSQLIDVRVSDLDRRPPANVTPPPRIVLAQEAADSLEPAVVKPVQPPRVAPLGASAPTPERTAVADRLACTSVGPFQDLADAAHAQAALKTAGFESRQRLEQGELWIGYWVSVQNFESREAAEAALKSLLDSGVTDVYLMPGSEPASVLSLGVFSDYQRAQRRAEEIRVLGLEPRIDDRKRAGSVYWIDADLQEPGQAIDTSIFQTDPGKITRLELRACPAGSGNG